MSNFFSANIFFRFQFSILAHCFGEPNVFVENFLWKMISRFMKCNLVNKQIIFIFFGENLIKQHNY